MGTSTDRTGGTGGDWTPLKRAATAYVRGLESGAGNPGNARRLLGRHVAVLGGAAAAAAGSRAGTNGLQRLGGLLTGISHSGLGPTLADIGLAGLVGRDRFEVLDELVTLIAGDGGELDAQAARDAACDVLDELFVDADTWDDLAAVAINAADLIRLLRLFLSAFVYNRVPIIAERLARLTDPEAARRADDEIRQIIEDIVVLSVPEDPLSVDWAGEQGRSIAEGAVRDTYRILEALEQEP